MRFTQNKHIIYANGCIKNAQKLQQAIKEKGIEVAVPEYTGLETDNPIAVKVIEEYHKLNS